ncbi:malate dehydrogenase [Sarcoptes scabiei]|nr:malate dehydrogenase [Sarcoptes scabiei]
MDAHLYPGFLEYFIRERVLVFGGPESGKTSLIKRLMKFQFFPSNSINDEFCTTRLYRTFSNESNDFNELSDSSTSSSVSRNSDQHFFISQYANANIIMPIWDIVLEHQFIFLDPHYTRPQSLLAIYDSSDIEEFYAIQSSLQIFLNRITPEQRKLLTIFVVANKIDNRSIVTIPYELERWLQINRISHFYSSAVINKGIDMLRACMLQCIYRKHFEMNLWIHRDLIRSRLLAKYRNSIWSEEENNEICIQFDYDHCFMQCSQQSRFEKETSNLFLDNIRLAVRNFCQYLDHLATISLHDKINVKMKKIDKTSPKIVHY